MTSAYPCFTRIPQVYKSMGDIKVAKEMYDRYAEVSGSWASWRQIVVDRRQPRSILVQANTSIKDEKLDLHSYEASAEGFVRYEMCPVPFRGIMSNY